MKNLSNDEIVAVECYLQRLLKDELLSDEEAVEVRKAIIKQSEVAGDNDVGIAA